MRPHLLLPMLLALSIGLGRAASANPAPDLSALEQAWHSCVREAFSRQSASESRRAAERSAFDECKEHEDTYVMAILAAQIAAKEAHWQTESSVTSRATAWVSYVAVYVVDPVSSWLRRWKR